uniref:EGF-like domain-containing protein n=1 Tax=Rhodosorus marinus TaxID=101924 RepID=A0A7S3A3G4_9RHOD
MRISAIAFCFLLACTYAEIIANTRCSLDGTEYVDEGSNTCVCKSGWTTSMTSPQDRVYCDMYLGSDGRDEQEGNGEDQAGVDLSDDIPDEDPYAEEDDETFYGNPEPGETTTHAFGLPGLNSMSPLLSIFFVILIICACLGCCYQKNGTLPPCCACCLMLCPPPKDDIEHGRERTTS